MAAPKRTKFERERDLERTSQLYLQRWTMAKIASEIGVSLSQIAYDLGTIRRRWREDAFRAISERVAEELARLDAVERAAWEAWARSVGESTRRTVKQKGGSDERTTVAEDLSGDPRFLDCVLRCIERRCKLLGIEGPERVRLEVGERSLPSTFAQWVKAATLARDAVRRGNGRPELAAAVPGHLRGAPGCQ